jgi:hypothetical protein
MIMTTVKTKFPEPAGSPQLEDLLDAWSAARHYSEAAYEAWCSEETARERRMGYAVVIAAMDREEAAEREVLRALGLAPGRRADRSGRLSGTAFRGE